jgi:hypothetical protein
LKRSEYTRHGSDTAWMVPVRTWTNRYNPLLYHRVLRWRGEGSDGAVISAFTPGSRGSLVRFPSVPCEKFHFWPCP